jgi:quercetin dioxygenase-like cupin family protein
MQTMKDYFMENTTDFNIPSSRLKLNEIVTLSEITDVKKDNNFSLSILKSNIIPDDISLKMISLESITPNEVSENYKNLLVSEEKYGIVPTISNKDRFIFIYKGKTNVFFNNESKRMAEGQYISIPANTRLNLVRLSTSECKVLEISKKDQVVVNTGPSRGPIKLAYFSEKYLSQFRVSYNKEYAKKNFLPKELYDKPYNAITDDEEIKKIIKNIYPTIKDAFDKDKNTNDDPLKILELPKDMHSSTIKIIGDYISKKYNAFYNEDNIQCFRYNQNNFIFDKNIKSWDDAYSGPISMYIESIDDIAPNARWPHIDLAFPQLFRVIVFLNDVTKENGGTKYLKNFDKEFYSFNDNTISGLFENDQDFIKKAKGKFDLNYFPCLLEYKPNDLEWETITGPAGTIVFLSPGAPHFVPSLTKGYRDAVMIAMYSNDFKKVNSENKNV